MGNTGSVAVPLAAVLVVVASGCGAGEGAELGTVQDAPVRTARDGPGTPTPSPEHDEPLRIASADGVDLYLPAQGALLVAFHEGAGGAAELTAEIPTRAVHNGDAEAGVTTDAGPIEAMVLPSRQRAASATSAVDVVLPPALTVLSPVTGEVAAVREYALYGKHPDVRIEIAPDGHPGARVVVLHVQGPRVETGDRVDAGRTPIADHARELDVGSQVDRFTVRSWLEEPRPHVHLEVRPVAAG